jgi:hypothetical protein
MRFILIIIIFIVLTSCNKQKTFNFPIGKWEAIDYIANRNCKSKLENNYGFLDNTDFCQQCDNYFLNKPVGIISVEYTGNDKLILSSPEGIEEFRLKKLDLETENLFQNYILHLKNKKGKTFRFTYSFISDTIMIGDYWIKNKAYSSFYAPNVHEIRCIYKSNGKTVDGRSYKEEILAVYKKVP